MEEMNLSETTTEEEEPGRPSGAILSLALGKQRKSCWMFSSSKLKVSAFYAGQILKTYNTPNHLFISDWLFWHLMMMWVVCYIILNVVGRQSLIVNLLEFQNRWSWALWRYYFST